jgi:addiction module HigA family antidote
MILIDPAHPGELIREAIEGLREETGQKFTIEEVAQRLGITRKTLSALINCKQKLTPEVAVRLEAAFPNTSAQFWLNVQENYDLAKAKKTIDVSKVRPLWEPSSAAPAGSK